MKFWDSSAVVPLLVEEPGSAARLAELEADPVMVVWWATPTECASALQRLMRDGGLTPDGVEAARARLEELARHWVEVEPTQSVRQQAGRLLRIHPLRAADALQLAAAILAADYEPFGLVLLTADVRLREAATKEGFTVA